jgi:hypothetical protein
MTEINAYMNGYSIGDIKFLEASVEAHKEVLENTKFDLETAKEFLYLHIQTNKELEKALKDALEFIKDDTPELARLLIEGVLKIGEDPSETHAATHPEMYFEK